MQACSTDALADLLENWGHMSKFFACSTLYPLAPWAPAVTAQLQQQDYLLQQQNIWGTPPHHVFIPGSLGASLTQQGSAHSREHLLPNLSLQSQRYLWSLRHPPKYLQCNLEQMWHLWQNPQMRFVSTHGYTFASRSTGPGHLPWLLFFIPTLRCHLTISIPCSSYPPTREQLLSPLPHFLQAKSG